ncbi:MAG: 30S ribosomal protein S8 [Candidatus Omnitrophica bacterium]|nr:30S ribosomal protein S8 [Candidatus Omnitrophota bacterium]MCM8802307.1 30S ribosomal protein S8 [Candidatus Omnitrophota bacterium]
MTMTDPIADMLTRIRNANMVSKPYVDIPFSNFKMKILDVLKEEKYIKDYELIENNSRKYIRVHLLYFGKNKAITEIKRISAPGRRIYVSKDKIPIIKNNYGIAVLTTSKGVMSSKKAKEVGIGGELLFYIW